MCNHAKCEELNLPCEPTIITVTPLLCANAQS